MNSVEKKKRIRDIKKNLGEQMRQFKKQARVMLIDDNYDHLAGVKELLSMESSFDIAKNKMINKVFMMTLTHLLPFRTEK